MNFYNIDGVNIPYDKSWKNIAISVSGGADSALLSFLLCSLLNEKTRVHIISHKRMWKTRPWQSYDSENVYAWLTQRFPKIEFRRYTNFIAPDIEYGNIGASIIDEYDKSVSGDNIQQRAYAEYICHYNDVDAYYNAVTRNPRGIDLGGMVEREVDRTDTNAHLEIMQHMGRYAIHPFRFVSKDWVVKQYIDNDISELFDMTRSCEGEFEGIDYKTYVPGQYVPICGNCFWCREREWAIGQNK
jgi:hypothetical protein